MKKLLPLIATLLTVTVKAQTSVYHPFPDSNAHWNWFATVPPCGMDINYMWYSFALEGDTTIGAHIYHKLYTPYYIVSSMGVVCPFFRWLGYQGGIRQDTSAKKVFYLFSGNTIEALLYDFNLQVGDTVLGVLADSGWCNTTVTAMDSVQCSSGWRTRWEYTSDGNRTTQVIEGIGTIDGMLEHNCVVTSKPFIQLNCFSENGQIIYPANAISCDLIDSVKNIFTKNLSIEISPNPFHSSTLLQVSSAFVNAKLNIYNSLGAIIRGERISNQKTFVLNRNELHNGIYLLQLINEGGQMITGKLIVK